MLRETNWGFVLGKYYEMEIDGWVFILKLFIVDFIAIILDIFIIK